MKTQFIKIQDKRYRLTTIKIYEPFSSEGKYGIYIYFTVTRRSDRCYHRFESENDRNKVLFELDEVFNIKY